MDTLPEEMVSSILRFISYKELMKCREVSRKFKSAASGVARRRHVRLRAGWTPPNFEDMFFRFQDLGDDLPWSSCTLEIIPPSSFDLVDPLSPRMVEEFLGAFGTYIRKVKLSGNEIPRILNALKAMPNLEVLTFGFGTYRSLPEDWEGVMEAENNTSIKNKKLKTLKIDDDRIVGKVLEIFFNPLNFQHQLEYVHLRIKSITDWNDPKCLLQRLATIPNLSVSFEHVEKPDLKVFEYLTGAGLNVTRLRVDSIPISSFINDSPEFFKPLDEFLIFNSNRLTYLRIGDSRRGRRFHQECKLTVPLLPNLQKLHLDCRTTPKDLYPLMSLTPFTTNQFPKLHEVIVTQEEGYGIFLVFAECHFDSVKELKIVEDGPVLHHSWRKMDWNRVFPNLEKVEAQGASAQTVWNILTKMNNLEHLALSAIDNKADAFGKMFSCNFDSLIIRSIYPNAAIAGDITRDENGQEIVEKCKANILLLKKLKTLSIDFRNCDLRCNLNPSRHLQLLRLHPLECLTLRGVRVPEACCKRLSAHHKKFLHEFTLKEKGVCVRTKLLD